LFLFKGECNSAKVEGIVKCLVKILDQEPDAKCLVFSEHATVLEMIGNLLTENLIQYVYAKSTNILKKHIDDFKNNLATSVLLMPYSYGANGLNIIEATHVLLVEPTLNKSQEVQAIGRVHRIGQTKPTFVYRFLIRNTIEELVYSLFKSSTSYSKDSLTSKAGTSKSLENVDQCEAEKVITINDIKALFLYL
jgi:E3 ubiquitin-protein ligase SHPRH